MVHWGIIGLGNIAERFAKSLQNSAEGCLYAVASKQQEKRALFTDLFPGIKTYDHYVDLLHDESLNAVYIALPHSMHMEITIKALQAQKGVLCEKPIALCEADARSMYACARSNNVFLMEAMKTRFVPIMDRIRKELCNGSIGDIKSIYVSFLNDIKKARIPVGNYIFDPDEGGALLDAGSYPIAFVLDLLGYDFILTDSKLVKSSSGLIRYASCDLIYPDGATAHIEVGIDRQQERIAIITGTRGVMRIPMWNRPIEYKIRDSNGRVTSEKIDLQYDDLFEEIEEVHRCLRLGLMESERYSWQDSLKVIRTIDQIQLCAAITINDESFL